ncbi:hypothetical protein AMJ49_00140 [Parcubacteria bacterium DG_74_2]|nr:MAG: hypothetical protein AMJ49_00140 [Parcubacteria bacterium DG_74_2]
MFYQCSKCKKVWQYPVEKCPDCFLKLDRLENKKIKVIGVSKVTIPTLFHPKAPYFVLVLEDEKGNKWVQKSVREYKIGDNFEIQKSRDKNAVAIWRIKYDVLEGIEKVIEIIGDLDLKENSKILILPSLYKASHSYFRDNTSPEFLQATLNFLFQKGFKPENIKIGAQSFDETSVESKAKKSGLLDVCLKNKISPSDLSKTKFIKKENFEISEEAFKSDFILNLPILKMGKASASENPFFLLKKENYLRLKHLSEDKEIFENLNKVLPQCLTVAEADSIQDLEKFTTFFGLAIASLNALNIDRIFFEITKKGELPEILKEIKIENIPILGRKIEEVAL